MFRIGHGFDRHRLTGGRRCVLGGVEFPESPLGPIGHSDGDAVCHALIDALLGAAGLGDIGTHFPDSDPEWAGADSVDLLARIWNLVKQEGYRLVNADCTIVAEAPRIAPHMMEMRERLAPVLEADPGDLSIKGTRGEGLGPEGRAEGLTAMAVVLLERS